LHAEGADRTAGDGRRLRAGWRGCALYGLFLLGCGAEHVIGSLGFRVELHATSAAEGSLLLPAVADVDADGRRDVVLVDGSAARICWLPGLPDGTLGALSCKPHAAVLFASLVAALQESAARPADLVVAGATPTVVVLAGGGDGDFSQVDAAVTTGGAAALIADDVNLDGIPDILVAERTEAAVSIWPLSAGRRLGSRVRYTFPEPPRALLFADIDDDQRKDLAGLSENQLSIIGPYGAANVAQCPPGPGGVRFGEPTALAAFPADEYGDTELLLADRVRGGLVRVRKSGGWSFDCGDGALWLPAGRAVALLSADFDGDGSVDGLAIFEAGEALFLSRSAAWTARAAPRYRLPGPVKAAALGDLDGDGRPEALVTLASGELVVLRNLFVAQKSL
jgi:hypothetical protein